MLIKAHSQWLIALASLLASSAPAVAADLDAASTYLEHTSAAYGGFGNLPLRDTDAVVQALQAQRLTADPEGLQAAWLEGANPLTLDSRLRVALALTRLEGPSPETTALLEDFQSGDGGYPFFPQGPSSILETALAVQLMRVSQTADLALVTRALDWLSTQADSSGGFGYDANAPTVALTAEVLLALQAWRSVVDLEAPIDAAVGWLASQQQSSGAFGTGPHPLLDTALALTVSSGEPNLATSSWILGATWLEAAQEPSSQSTCAGSWDCDPYTTAWAILAFQGFMADLVVEDLSFSPAGQVVESAPLTVTATLRNRGMAASPSGVVVDFSLESASSSSVNTLGQAIAGGVAPGSTTRVTLTFDTTGFNGPHYLTAQADATAKVDEKDESNNTLSTPLTFTPRVDLAITDADLSYSPEDPGLAETITFEARVSNAGGFPAAGLVRFILDPQTDPVVLSEQSVSLDAGASVRLTTQTLLEPGTHTLEVTLDPDQALEEGLEDNNQASLSLVMQERKDLVILSEQIYVSPSTVVEPDSVQVAVTVFNQREDLAEDVVVQAYMFDSDTMDAFVDAVPVGSPVTLAQVPGNATALAYLQAPTGGYPGNNYLVIKVDPDDSVAETLEDNNTGYARVTVTPQGNLNTVSTDMSFSPSTATESATVRVNLNVRNNGGGTLSGGTVRFSAAGPSSTSVELGTVSLPTLATNTYATASIDWSTTGLPAGTWTITGTVDPNNTVVEKLETDNVASKTFTLTARADLSVVASEVTLTPSSPEEGDAATISATIRNLGPALSTSYVFLVRIWDGDPSAGGILLSEQSRAGLGASSSFVVTCPMTTLDQDGPHTLTVQVDPTDTVSELVNSNNVAQKNITILAASRPDLSVTASDLSLTPASGVSPGQVVTVNAVVKNLRDFPASSADIRLYAGDPSSGGIAISTQTVSVPALGQTAVSFEWTTPSSSYTSTSLFVVADPDLRISESDETNNRASILYRGRAGAETTPQNAVASLDYHTVTLNWQPPTDVSQVVGYRVYRNGSLITPVESVMSGATATGDSQSSASYPASAAIDASSSTYWLTSSHAAPWWIEVTLPQARLLTRASLSWHSSYRGSSYQIQGWDGSTWQTLFSVTGNTNSTPTHEFTTWMSTQKLRLYVTASSSASYVGLYDLKLYGSDPLSSRTLTDPNLLSSTYRYAITSVTRSGFESPDASPPSVDIALPQPPTGLTTLPDFTRMDLGWDSTAEPSPYYYIVSRDGLRVLDDAKLSGGTASADSVNSTTYSADKARDGSSSTYWLSTSHASPWWWELALSSPALVTRVDLTWQGSYRGIDYAIQGWDGTRWRTLQQISGNTSNSVQHTLDQPFPTAKLRITVTTSTSTSYAGLYEVEVYSTPILTTPALTDTYLLEGPYTYEVEVMNYLGELSQPASTTDDVPPPLPPDTLSASLGENSATLSWSAVDNPSATSYLLYRDGSLIFPVSEQRTGGTASADSSSSTTYTPDKALDANGSTYWLSASHTAPWYWEISWTSPRVLTKASLTWQSSYRGIDYDIQGFDGKYWRTLAAIRGNSSNTISHPLSPMSTQKLRISISRSSSTSYAGLYEVNLEGLTPYTSLSYADTNVPGGPRAYAVSVLNTLGEESSRRTSLETVPIPPPSGLIASVSGDDVSLSWSASSATKLAGYHLYRAGSLLNAPGSTNVALGGTPNASSTTSGYYVSALNDNSTSSVWYGQADQPTWSAEVILPTARTLTGIGIAWASSYQGIQFQVQARVAGIWQTQGTFTNNSLTSTTLSFPGISADGIRVLIQRSSSSYPGIQELRALLPAPITTLSTVDRNVPAGTWQYDVRAVDVYGGESAPASAIASVGNLLPPTNLTGSASSNGVSLSWTASPSSGVQGYLLYRDDLLVNAQPEVTTPATVSASSVYSTSTSYQASNAVDGNASSYWYSATGSAWTYTLEWSQPRRPSQVTLSWHSSYRGVNYDLQSWNGSTWATELEVRGNTENTVTHRLTPSSTTSKLRINILSSSSTYVALYEVDVLEPTLITATSASDTVSDNGTYRYSAKAVSSSLVSVASEPVSITVTDTGAPSTPTNLRVSSYSSTSVTLAWNASTDADHFRFRLYYPDSATALTLVNNTSYTHSSVLVASKTSYTWHLTALDRNGNEGPPAAVTFAPGLPAPPNALTATVQGPDVLLGWSLPTDALRKYIHVYRDGSLIANTVAASATSYLDTLIENGTHTWQVASEDIFGREGTLTAPVTAVVNDTDFSLSSTDLFFLPQAPSELDDVMLSAVVNNDGQDPTEAVEVYFYDGDPQAGGFLLGTGIAPAMAPGALGLAQLSWNLTDQAGDHVIHAVVDPLNVVVEFYENNNSASKALHVEDVPKLDVDITQVDASLFPTVVASFQVKDMNGQAVPDLTSRNLSLTEDLVDQVITRLELTSTSSSTQPKVDLVSIIDTSGSMDGELLDLPKIMTDLQTQLILRGVDAKQVNYSMSTNLGGVYTQLTTGIFKDAVITIGQEDWAPATAWVAKNFPWRTDAVRIIVPVSDENCYQGDGQDANDVYSLQEAIRYANTYKATVFGLWGEPTSTSVKQEHTDLSVGTGGEAFSYLDANNIVDAIVLSVMNKVAVYKATYTTTNTALDGALRALELTALYRNAEGIATGEYRAPSSGRADLTALELRLLPGNPASGELASLQGRIANLGSASAEALVHITEGSSLPVVKPLLLTLEPAQVETFTVPYLAVPGTHALTLTIDPEDSVAESQENNNEARTTLFVPGASVAELALNADEVTLSPAAPVSGDTVTLSAVVRNLGVTTKDVLVQVWQGEPGSGTQVGDSIRLAELLPLAAEPIQVTWNSSGVDGDIPFSVVVDPLDSIVELREDNNRVDLEVPVEARALKLFVQTDQTAYPAQTDVAITGRVESRQLQPFTGTVALSVLDEAGNVVGQLDPVVLERLPGAIYPDRRYFVPVSFPASALLRGNQLAAATVNFTSTLTALGGTGSLSVDSIRVAEVDSSGELVAFYPARSLPAPGYDAATAAKRTVFFSARAPERNTGTRTFRIYFDTQEAGSFTPEAPALVSSELLAVATDQGAVYVSRKQASGAFSTLTSVDSFGVRVRVAVTDLDGDGIQDLLAYDGNRDLYWLAGLADGRFAAKVLLQATDSTAVPSDILADDFNQDGLVDVLVTEQSTVPRLYTQGAGMSWIITNLTAASATIYSADLADYTGDGLIDVLVGQTNGLIGGYVGKGDGTFQAISTLCDTPGIYPYGLTVADFDGDATLDLLSNQGSSGNAYLCRGNVSSPTFGTAVETTTLRTTTYAAYDDLDYNGDGKRDVVVATYTSKSTLLYAGHGTGAFSSPITLASAMGDAFNAAVSGGQELEGVLGTPGLNLIPTVPFVAEWNTGLNLAGPYSVQAILQEGGDERTRASTALEITATSALSATVGTDRPSYGLNELVEIQSLLVNETLNASLFELEATLSVLDPSGTELQQETLSHSVLLSGEEASFTRWFSVGNHAPGQYTIRLDVSAVGADALQAVTTVATSTFEVSSTAGAGLGLVGSLSLDPSQGLPGTQLGALWDVINRGNAPLTGVNLQLLLAPLEVETTLETLSLGQVALQVGETATGTTSVTTDELPLGDYQAILQAEVEGEWRSLALSSFRLIELLGTLSVSPSTLEGGIEDALLAWSVTNGASSSLGEVSVSLRIEDASDSVVATIPGPTTELLGSSSLTGEETWPSALLGVGDYSAFLDATLGGVQVTLASQEFTVVDSLAPQSTLSWNGIEITQDGHHYMPSATEWVLSATDSFSSILGIAWQVDGKALQPYTGPLTLEEGTHTFAWQATDAAGNAEALQQVSAVVDDSSPDIRIEGLGEGACIPERVQPVVTITDLSPYTHTMTLDGVAWAGTPISTPGPHTLQVDATDLLGNTSSQHVNFTLETGSCACQSGDAIADADSDGERACDGDCNDQDPSVNTHASEATDGKDNDCDGLVDEGFCPTDADGDGFATSGGDCDDTQSSVHPAALETPDGKDSNCNGQIDEEAPTSPDADGDGMTRADGDCDDTHTSTFPGAVETPDDGRDNNCDGQVDETRLDCDADQDGHTELEGDCNDQASDIYPGAPDACDIVDQDCDGTAEEDCATPTPSPEPETPTASPDPATPTPWTPGPETPTPWTPRPDSPTPETDTPDSSATPEGSTTPDDASQTPGASTPTAPPDTGESSSTPTGTPTDEDSGACRCASGTGETEPTLPLGLLGMVGLAWRRMRGGRRRIT